jgi:hypothetical protein
MTPSTRSSVKIQQMAAGEWRVIEGGESRRLTTEEMNDFVVQNSSLKQELDRAMMEAKEGVYAGGTGCRVGRAEKDEAMGGAER